MNEITPTDKFIEEMVKSAHLKWLEKAKTVKIDGSEMTVLPYGYLGQAIKEALHSVLKSKHARQD